MFANPKSGTNPPSYPGRTMTPSIVTQEAASKDDDATLAGLKEIVSRQQNEIETQQQQLVAKEQRLKYLKQPENTNVNDETVNAMKEKLKTQQRKLEWLQELKGKVDHQSSLNSTELDNVKALFKEKEHELQEAVTRVTSLSKQLDNIRSNKTVRNDKLGITAEELTKLKNELKTAQEVNAVKNHELAVELDLLNQRNKQVDYLDKRIEELQIRLRKKKQTEQNPTSSKSGQPATGANRKSNTNIATVEPSIRIEPPPINTDPGLSKAHVIPNPNDPRYQTLPNNFKYNRPEAQPISILNERKEPGKVEIQYSQPVQRDVPPQYAQTRYTSTTTLPAYNKSRSDPRPRPAHNTPTLTPYTPTSNYTPSPDMNENQPYQQNQNLPPSSRPSSAQPNTSNKQYSKPMYASRSVIADTYMKRLGPKITPKNPAFAPHSIPAFHLQNSIISDKVSSKNNTLRSLRRRHSYTESEDNRLDLDNDKRLPAPVVAVPAPAPVQKPILESPPPQQEEPQESRSPQNLSSSSIDISRPSQDGSYITKSILSKDIGTKRNLTRRVKFDPLALLLDASLEGEIELVQHSAAQIPDASQSNNEGITALHNAICAGHYDIVKFLVEFGVDVNSQDIDGWTPLHCASSCNNLAMVQLLVEHGACIYAQTISDHETPAEKCEEDDDGCANYLIGIQEKLGVMNGGVVYALFDYEAGSKDELSFRNGDRLVVKRKDPAEEEWWWAVSGEAEGYIPRTFVGLFPRKRT